MLVDDYARARTRLRMLREAARRARREVCPRVANQESRVNRIFENLEKERRKWLGARYTPYHG